MIVGVPKETFLGERRVALVPASIASLHQVNVQCLVESGAGHQAGYEDEEYRSKGAQVVDRKEVFERSDVIVHVRAAGANPDAGRADLNQMRPGQTLIGLFEPLWQPMAIKELAQHRLTTFALELMPRISRAQTMDVLSSMATVSGYKAVLMAANHLPRMFPMLMTAGGTIMPAKVFIVGAGVAGLQAITVAHRLGGIVQAYDVRPTVREEVQSVGAKFLELPLESDQPQQSGEYARDMSEDFYRRQRELMTRVVSESDVVVTTAAIPGKRSPVLITANMVRKMTPGSVIVDVAAERGGNCELTRPDEVVVDHGVTIFGPVNLPSEIPFHASQLFARNVVNFLLYMVKDGEIKINVEDEIIRDTLVTREGKIVNTRVQQALETNHTGAVERSVV